MRVLKAIGSISVLTATVVSAGPALAGEISGKQYVVLKTGAAPLSDNLIHVVPCNSKDEIVSVPIDCSLIETQSEFDLKILRAGSALTTAEFASFRSKYSIANSSEEVGSYAAWRTYTRIDKEIVPMLKKKPGYKTIRTNFGGEFLFNCPTKKCLVYSSGTTGRAFGYWMIIGTSGSKLDLSPSSGHVKNMPSSL